MLILYFIAGCIAFLSQSTPVYAYLGGRVESVRADRLTLQAHEEGPQAHEEVRQSRIRARSGLASFSIHEIHAQEAQIREYVSENGIVFAVTWIGPRHPKFSSLLGSYVADYQQARQEQESKLRVRRRRQAFSVRSERVVVELGGHTLKMRGRAYVPELLPTGVNVDEIR